MPDASVTNFVLDDLVEQIYQALVAALWEGKASGDLEVARTATSRLRSEREVAAGGHATWSRGRCAFTVSVDKTVWAGSIRYHVGKSRHNTISRIESWMWPEGPSNVHGTAIEFAVHPGDWARLASMVDVDFTSTFLYGLQGTMRASVADQSVPFWAPSILHVMAQLHQFVSDHKIRSATIDPIDQEYPILLERGDSWAAMTITKSDTRHVLRTSRSSFEKAVARALDDLAVLLRLRTPAILEKPGLAWLQSSRLS